MYTKYKLIVLVLLLFVISCFVSSCGKNSFCRCTEFFQDGTYSERIYNPEGEKVKTCSELENKLNVLYGEGSYTCSEL